MPKALLDQVHSNQSKSGGGLKVYCHINGSRPFFQHQESFDLEDGTAYFQQPSTNHQTIWFWYWFRATLISTLATLCNVATNTFN